jgi:hypothetical protein
MRLVRDAKRPSVATEAGESPHTKTQLAISPRWQRLGRLCGGVSGPNSLRSVRLQALDAPHQTRSHNRDLTTTRCGGWRVVVVGGTFLSNELRDPSVKSTFLHNTTSRILMHTPIACLANCPRRNRGIPVQNTPRLQNHHHHHRQHPPSLPHQRMPTSPEVQFRKPFTLNLT